MWCLNPALLLLVKLIGLVPGLRAETSSFSQVPFLSVWNAPTGGCLSKYGVHLDLGTFSIVHNKDQTFMGDNMTIFYSGKLGLYPWYAGQGQAINGGVPQNASLEEHLRVAAEDINTDIPDGNFQGLAVVDWESWRPVWERNWDSKGVYQEASRELVRSAHPDWSPAQIDAEARASFEEAARKFMEGTLKLGQRERPDGLWGFYGFPNCYNYYEGGQNYSGECPDVEVKRNDDLSWLWNTSSALYPDIYLSLKLRGLGKEVLLYARHRILEAMRAGAQATPSTPPPVFPYADIVYSYTLEFLSQEHLVYTIGESAALGSAGVVLWGNNAFSKSRAACEAVRFYIDETLGHYLVNVTTAATLCSQALCSSRGRCQRKDPSSRAYLHLDPAVWKVVPQRRPDGVNNYRVSGRMKAHEFAFMKSEFQCKCFPGWGGPRCSEPAKQ